MEQSKIKIEKHIKGYKELKKAQIAELKALGFKGAKLREMITLWDYLFKLDQKKHDAEIDWYKGMPAFKEVEYRIHPLMGHQVRSRKHYEPPGQTQEERLAAKKHTSRRKPKITPFDLDPDYKDPKEPVHGEADLKGVKQYPVTLKVEDTHVAVKFEIKSARLKRAVEVLELKIGYDHKTNRHVLYSPLKYNERWDRQSQVIWLRTIGMSPVRISKQLDIKYDTVKNWLRALKGQPLVATSKYDWAVRQVEGRGEYFSKFSSPEAKPRAPEVIQ
jgi:hypothetical protein